MPLNEVKRETIIENRAGGYAEAQRDMLINAINCNIPHKYIREMVSGGKEPKKKLSHGIMPVKARESGYNRRISNYGIEDLTAIYPQYPRGLWKMHLRKRR